MTRYAIEQEYKMADFYLSFDKTFPDAWKKIRIQMLVMEERSHAAILLASYPQINSVET